MAFLCCSESECSEIWMMVGSADKDALQILQDDSRVCIQHPCGRAILGKRSASSRRQGWRERQGSQRSASLRSPTFTIRQRRCRGQWGQEWHEWSAFRAIQTNAVLPCSCFTHPASKKRPAGYHVQKVRLLRPEHCVQAMPSAHHCLCR